MTKIIKLVKLLGVWALFTSFSSKPVVPKIVGYYDLLGRQVYSLQLHTIYVVKYENGQHRQVIRTK